MSKFKSVKVKHGENSIEVGGDYVLLNVKTTENPKKNPDRYKIETLTDVLSVMHEIGEEKHERFLSEMQKFFELQYVLSLIVGGEDTEESICYWIDD